MEKLIRNILDQRIIKPSQSPFSSPVLLVRKKDTCKIAFRTHDGHFEFLVMPFGLTNTPSTFQAAVNQLFSSYLCRFVIVFFDDILFYSSFMIAHLEHLELVLHHLYSHQLYVKLSKCLFCKGSIQYLGHIIYSAGVHANSKKIEAMVQWSLSKTVKQLRGLLGLIGYCKNQFCSSDLRGICDAM